MTSSWFMRGNPWLPPEVSHRVFGCACHNWHFCWVANKTQSSFSTRFEFISFLLYQIFFTLSLSFNTVYMPLGNTNFSITHYPKQITMLFFFLLPRETNKERCLVNFDAQYVYKCERARRLYKVWTGSGFWGPALSAFVNMELVKVSLSVFRHFYIFFLFLNTESETQISGTHAHI